MLPGIHVKSFGSAFGVAAIYGLLKYFLGWIFFVVFAIGTLGIAVLLAFITRWIINAILLKITDAVSDALTVDSFGWALSGALMMSFIGSVGEWVVRAVF